LNRELRLRGRSHVSLVEAWRQRARHGQ